MDTVDQLHNHIATMNFLQQRMLCCWSEDMRAKPSDEKRIRTLIVYALRQQIEYGQDISIESMTPLLEHLRGPDTLVAYSIDPLASNIQSSVNDVRCYFVVEENGDSGEIGLRAIADNGVIDLTLDDTFLLRAFVQEDHSIAFVIATQTLGEPLIPSTIYHGITGSPRIRLFGRIAGQPNVVGQIRVVQPHMPDNTFAPVSIYANRLSAYITTATTYLEAMTSYGDASATGRTTQTNDHIVVEALKAFIDAKESLLWADNFAGRDRWLYQGLQKLQAPMVLPDLSCGSSSYSATGIYIMRTHFFIIISLMSLLITVLCNTLSQ